MEIGTTELDAAFQADGGIEDYTPEVTRGETISAAYDNFVSVNLSNSKDKHYKEVMETETKGWIEQDPQNKDLYERMANYDIRDIEKLEALYEDNPESVRGFIQTNPFNVDIFLTEDFLKMKDIQGVKGHKSIAQINEDIKDKANAEYSESLKTLQASDHWGMEMIGTMGGALTDVKTLQTLPLGTWSAGRGVLGNAMYSFAQEFGIEALAQTSIAPEVYAFKKELGIKTSIAQEATQAVMSMATAGLVRGAGSAAFDLTPLGKSALKLKDPELAADYDNLTRGQATDSVDEHINNLNKVEFGSPVTKIDNPNEAGVKINEAEDIAEYDIPQKEILEPEVKVDEPDMEIVTGKTLEGDIETKTYKQINDEIDLEAEHIRRVEECLL